MANVPVYQAEKPLLPPAKIPESGDQFQNLNRPFKLPQGIQLVIQLDNELKIVFCFKAQGLGQLAAKAEDLSLGRGMGTIIFDNHVASFHRYIAQFETFGQQIHLEV